MMFIVIHCNLTIYFLILYSYRYCYNQIVDYDSLFHDFLFHDFDDGWIKLTDGGIDLTLLYIFLFLKGST